MGSKVKYLNFTITQSVVNIFTEIVHAGRVTIDMEPIKHDFRWKAWVPEAKNQLFQNMVMLYIKLKGMIQAETW